MPVIRLFVPFFLGILLQYYWPVTVSVLQGLAMISTGILVLSLFPLLTFFSRYKLGFINGLSAFSLFAVLGGLSVWQQDIRLRPFWPGNIYKENDALIIKIEDTPIEKTKTLKATASITAIIHNDSFIQTRGGVLLYFIKDSSLHPPSAGDVLITRTNLQTIPSSANPGGFDFQRYSLFQGITHQLFLRANDFTVIRRQPSILQQILGQTREWVLAALRQSFDDPKERGLAEALLIGYKNDLDKTLVQSYTNTGVVHIIAISGLHLGLIYWLLLKLFHPLRKRRVLKWLHPVLLISCLWLFALLAGAQPSVLRSALMFTCIIAGDTLSRKPNVYNSLALSAFLLLCYNPFWLWDAGFQLSYAALLGIVIFNKPIYQLFSIRNKLLDHVWQLNAVTLSAQIFTIPLCLYHFHQFPLYFLLSNFIAVPISSLILLAEILICCTGFIPVVALGIGKFTGLLIRFMNTYIERMESLPFSVWNGLQISFTQAFLLTLCLVFAMSCFTHPANKKWLLYGSAIAFSACMWLRSWSFIKAQRQQMIIVYQQSADFINGRHYTTIPTTASPDPIYTAASRSLFRLVPDKDMASFQQSGTYISFLSKKIIRLNAPLNYFASAKKIDTDLLILMQGAANDPGELCRTLAIRQVVADATIPAWKARRWQLQCDSLHIPFHDVRTKGAFVMNL